MTIKEMQKIYSKIPHTRKKHIWSIIKILESKKLTHDQKIKLITKKI